MDKIVVFTGAGISAESGLQTFRDSGGLWEQYNVIDVATPEAWQKNPKLVLEFYNKRKEQILKAKPNMAHRDLVRLEEAYDVQIITQNIDDLHERAGSSNVLHLHGEITKVRSTVDSNLVYDYGHKKIHINDLCDKGSQLRPHIVWFGEAVPNMDEAYKIVSDADILIVVGTSLVVYPAAGVINFASKECRKYIVDPHKLSIEGLDNCKQILSTASQGVSKLVRQLLANDDGRHKI